MINYHKYTQCGALFRLKLYTTLEFELDIAIRSTAMADVGHCAAVGYKIKSEMDVKQFIKIPLRLFGVWHT